MRKRTLLAAAALAAAVAVLVVLSLPPRRLNLAPQEDGTVAGAMHVHTNRSDGRSTPDQIAAIAARVGLAFVVFADHGDATRTPDPPSYRSGVLCLDGVEISTNGGHYIGLDMPAAPYPLGGDPGAVVEDVRRLGGFGIVTHPDSPKPALRWRDWTLSVDGFEVMNPDTSWRVHAASAGVGPKLRLASALLSYPARPEEAIASLFVDSAQLRRQVSEVWRTRRVVVAAGTDAHAKLELREGDPGDNRFSLPLPAYAASFRTLTLRVRPERLLSGDAAADARSVVGAMRRGSMYVAVDALAAPPAFEFTATNDRGTAEQGSELAAGGPVRLRIRSNAPSGFTTMILRDEQLIESRTGGGEIALDAPAGVGVYRVEVRATDRPRQPAWIVSNPIYVRSAAAAEDGKPPLPARSEPVARQRLFNGRDASGWSVETDPASVAALDVAPATSGNELRLRYGLAGGAPMHQYAALIVNTPGGVSEFGRLRFRARAERPMRVSVQLRVSVPGASDERWQRSVYLDAVEAERTIAFGEMTPIGATRTPTPPLDEVHSFMFAVELTNTKPGTSGRLWIREAALEALP